jgi:dienelactone hydrolase
MTRFFDTQAGVGSVSPIRVPVSGAVLDADLGLPERPRGIVVFAHGSGSGRHSARNRFVAEKLRSSGFGTLLADLLTLAEDAVDQRTATLRFDVDLLGDRVVALVDWIGRELDFAGFPIALFGASTGAAAALVAAAKRPREVAAVVSRGGRPDLAGDALPRVTAPTLLLVGALDSTVIDLNRAARRRMRAVVELEVIPGASHLFEEPGALDVVAQRADAWLQTHLRDQARRDRRDRTRR